MSAPSRVLVAGAGSAGRRHLRNLRALLPSAHLACWRMAGTASDPELDGLADSVVFDERAAHALAPDAVVVAGPAPSHVPVALPFVARRVPVLIEKPLCHRLSDADALITAAERAGGVALVGYMLRFHPLLLALRAQLAAGAVGPVMTVDAEVGQSLTEWRPSKPYTETVSARKALGGGALLELSHEFDYLSWLLGPVERVGAFTATLSGLKLDVEDCAALAVRFASGALGTVSMDLVRRPMRRGCRIHGREGTLELDLVGQRLRIGRADSAWEVLDERPGFDRNDLFLGELRHFLACVSGDAEPAVTLREGRHALAMALAAAQSASEGRMIDV
ncbi:MAG: Gfo/Idh/MocA family oxidoreductase [Acidobacteriota bacterium]|nr:Gfo/Idh/MocA family oxidoreductase [Acidobacteriota bacterium]